MSWLKRRALEMERNYHTPTNALTVDEAIEIVAREFAERALGETLGDDRLGFIEKCIDAADEDDDVL